ncbi:VIT family protein (plasmid) [Aminobacter sp. MSH1]|uniref:VIT1/CCC1 transporter family protein n=1 Tax=Aminobacter sp. MSH1 TaxID=374606 RepID=UPI000D50535B|nr:VIT1/CCC1 transporter family protein [Aminobacter sp. MSH1]ARD70042.2 VIT family protein [Aminobacter sp. MSH1]
MSAKPPPSSLLHDDPLHQSFPETDRRSRISSYFKEVIYGGTDGIITTFAVAAGFSGAALTTETTTQLSFLVVLLFGLANLFADGVSMGLSNFLSVRSEKDLYQQARARQTNAIRTKPDATMQRTLAVLEDKGYSTEDAHTLTRLLGKNETYWVDFLMNHHLSMSDPRGENPLSTGLATFVSFLVFGTIPLLPFMLADQSAPARIVFYYSILGTFAALVLLGILKWRVVGNALWLALLEVVLVGAAAASVAFFVGSLFSV